MISVTEVIVIGAGTAGLAASVELAQKNIAHIVLESTSSAGGSWKGRWDSFCLNTPNFINALGGENDPKASMWDKDGFISRDDFVQYLSSVAESLPINYDKKCVSIERNNEGPSRFTVRCTDQSDSTTSVYMCQFVIVASGCANIAKKVTVTKDLPDSVTSINSNEYLNASQLRDGNVLVVGGGNTGAQIAEDIVKHGSGSVVYWATYKYGRFPRRIYGFDSIRFPIDSGFFKQPTASIPKEEQHGPQPLVSGVGPRGHSMSIQYLHSIGAVPVGTCTRCDNDAVYFESNLISTIGFADFFYNMIKSTSKEFYVKQGTVDANTLMCEDDINDAPFSGDTISSVSNLSLNQCAEISELSFKETKITTIIWCIGFVGDYTYINIPGALDEAQRPIHTDGVSPVVGLYYNGLPMQRNRLSHLVGGAVQDASFVVGEIIRQQSA
jgi:putative flavoprotein involved in K+ transport